MAAHISEAMTYNTALSEASGRLYSTSVKLASHIEPLHLLAAYPDEARMYWRNGADGAIYAGVGASAVLAAAGSERFESIRTQHRSLFDGASMPDHAPATAMPRVFGGFSYYPETINSVWSEFPPAMFILPRVLLTEISGQTWLTISMVMDAEIDATPLLDAEIATVIDVLANTPTHDASTCALSIHYITGSDDWAQMVTEATTRIKHGELEKVVLARAAELRAEKTIDPTGALASLNERYPETYRFLIEPVPGHAFFGATPELLARIEGQRVFTDALAGSTRRGATPDEDAKLGRALLINAKERHEHQLVVSSIEASLADLTTELNIDEHPSLRHLRNIQHLHTGIEGTLADGVDALHIVEALHPTPALGGSPREAALELIAKLEAQPRGWYGAPIGWLDAKGCGVFAVAIRSAISTGNSARLYAGAGIVGDSQPESEWQETALKFRPLLDALSGGAA